MVFVKNAQSQTPLSASEIELLRRFVGTEPLFAVAKRLGMSGHALARGLAGVRLHAGTRLQIRMALAAQPEASMEQPS